MKETVQAAWKVLEKAYVVAKSDNPGLKFNNKAFDECYLHFKQWRKLLMEQFMKPEVMELDRHKIAAILTISIIESKAISYEGNLDDKIFLGTQLLAVTCGLSYMQSQLNKILSMKNEKQINKYVMPIPFSCETNYFDVIARNLYYEEHVKDSNGNNLWGLNPLQLANTYYFIELYTLEHYKINTAILKEN
ncbi:hypothetical protein AALA90_03130 [Lachnospiraceae bacterium 38-10]